ncbi:beta-lactamase domain protein [Gloeothece citriformis PCC 7424]|uniref:Beta-lactamase domain protein n=1 Tax=Gloeothece citriformis (strain PCC 7424) TaxID=65393 RepID=B7K8D0_GLOC7|nr:MBL fold metallo-hydrolase [Gloeothece citriformis]ACK69890.1 beta-lactamase domain protein [Gloeothece citriformis PCC 7424]
MSQRRPTSSDYQNQLSCFPYGVGHENEGICLLVEMGPYRILLDCGLEDIQPLQTDSNSPAHLVFCSHAHSDHARGLLALHQAFPQMPIYASHVTVELLPLNWLDHRSEEISDFCQGLQWRTPVNLFKDLSAEIFPAGHLPGAAAILLTYKTPKRTYKVFYTGDFSLSNFQLVEGLSVELLRGLAPDVLIIEGSYGTMRHPHRRQQEKNLMMRIYQALANGQSILLPVPTLGLGQEILKLLRSHHQFTGKDLDIWVDGDVTTACDAYLQLLSEFPVSVQNFAKHQSLFWDERICPRMRRLTPTAIPQLAINPSIVVTDKFEELGKYCLSNGRSWLILIPSHWHNRLDHSPLKELKYCPFVSIETYLLAEHSDSRNTTQLIHNLRPQHVIFVHGSPNYLADLTSLEELQNRYQLHSPQVQTLVELPIGEQFIQPVTPTPTQYEGELNEQGTAITITLPDGITHDPRWSHFSDTGLVEARWQGEELLIRGLSQRELLSHTNSSRRLEDIDCCGTCSHYKSQRCWNPASPLYGFKVTPEGYCPVFEPQQQVSES